MLLRPVRAGKVLEEFVQGIAGLQVVEHRADENAGADEVGRAAEDFWLGMEYRRRRDQVILLSPSLPSNSDRLVPPGLRIDGSSWTPWGQSHHRPIASVIPLRRAATIARTSYSCNRAKALAPLGLPAKRCRYSSSQSPAGISSGVQIRGGSYPAARHTAWIRDRSATLAMWVQFHVTR